MNDQKISKCLKYLQAKFPKNTFVVKKDHFLEDSLWIQNNENKDNFIFNTPSYRSSNIYLKFDEFQTLDNLGFLIK
jgi:hypothetical protein